jgi:hypothetical protein
VTPTGPLTLGSPVTVHVVPQPAPAPDPAKGGKHGKGKKND